ncbi:serine protease [Pelagibius sp. CAU 1746]|uniref:S1C family serine protease n=1 Tax=Pelagibius sp. CAU 1746 TaxID=3140370 RepID=UPI00325A9C67
MIVIVASFVSGCVATTSKKAELLQPIAVPTFEEPKPIAFKKIVLRVPRNAPIGSVGAGLACIKHDDYMPRSGRYSLDVERFNDIFREELESANYEVVGDPDELFGDPEINRANYFIAGPIKEIETNICFPQAGYGNFSTASASIYMNIEWQIYDTLRREVVMKIPTEGSAETEEATTNGDSITMDEAFAISVRNLLAQSKFHSLVRHGEVEAPVVAEVSKSSLTLASLALDSGTGFDANHLSQSVGVVRSATGHGTGFMITPRFMLTNQHVVGGAKEVRIIFGDGSEVEGQVVSRNNYRDVALIELVSATRRPLSLRTERLNVGANVYSYGAPLSEDFSGSLRQGIVSAYRIEGGLDYVQSDADVNPGNSGGPLLDEQGNVVGIAVSGIMIGGVVSQGINFFIPIDRALAAFDIAIHNGAPSS